MSTTVNGPNVDIDEMTSSGKIRNTMLLVERENDMLS